jgi:NAD(P)-dependent dehydrogenase (short-subunit alcohol dehydrogenase family)
MADTGGKPTPTSLPEPPQARTMLPAGTFDGQVIAITGGGTGLGLAMGLAFSRLGAKVAVLSRQESNRRAGETAIAADGGQAAAFPLDVRDARNVAGAFDEVEAVLGPVDVLVNNAAGLYLSPAEEISPNGFRAVMQIDAEGTFFCSREFARRAMARAASGAILSIGAYVSWAGGPGIAHAAAAKAAVHSLTRTLAAEWAPYGLRANALVPGLFPHADLPQAVAAEYTRPESRLAVPGRRFGRVDEIGWAATYLCSPFASYVTGEIFVIDGGYSLNRWVGQPEYISVRDQLAAAGGA